MSLPCFTILRHRTSSAVLIITFGLINFQCVPWEKNVTVNNILFEKFAWESTRGDRIGYLANDSEIQGYPCKKGFVVLHENLSLDEFTLSREFVWQGVVFPAGTFVFCDTTGAIAVCAFPTNQQVQGYICRGNGGIEGIRTGFYPNGRLRFFYPPEDIVIDCILCDASLFHGGISLHENGRLAKCKIAQNVVIDGIMYKKGAKLRLDQEGRVIQ